MNRKPLVASCVASGRWVELVTYEEPGAHRLVFSRWEDAAEFARVVNAAKMPVAAEDFLSAEVLGWVKREHAGWLESIRSFMRNGDLESAREMASDCGRAWGAAQAEAKRASTRGGGAS